MTPAINCLKKTKIKFSIHAYDHHPDCNNYGKEAADKLNISLDRIFKTLVVSLDNKSLAVALVPVSSQLDLKRVSKVYGSKKTTLADGNEVIRSTGYILGGVSPIGQKKRLRTVIDTSALNFDTVYVSAGRRGLQIEIPPEALGDLICATFADIHKTTAPESKQKNPWQGAD